MRLPDFSPREYAARTAVVVGTLAVLQYTGFLVDGSGGVDPAYLAAVAVLFPTFSYLLSVLAANVRRIQE
ncbi:hypothetical protein EKH57_05840 [Halorubrum sp. BOL3-1]|uniref:hypothetical protein n=1 Tax=Halorubrum sp. BOL3-1 TaxID=2497325 RepID=UPI001004F9FD|nr:hypothetical protein [Halorubrum sp. BOL3-1]QAU12276.1 hypothetical protein EKH57_05840 [Halorubrum sp. BOL3-1]